METKAFETIDDSALEQVSGGCFLGFGMACLAGLEAAEAACKALAAANHGCGGSSASPVGSLLGGCSAPSVPSAPSAASAPCGH